MKLVGERRALASAVFAFYFLLMMMQALLGGGPTQRVMYALGGVYGLAFFGLVAGYFWARWYSVGVGIFGVIVGVVAMWQLKALEPVFVFFGGTHLAAAVLLWGDRMSEPYEGQAAWRERYHMDDSAVQRLGRSVMRAGVSLPFVLIYGLMPRPEGGHLVALAVVGLALVGFGGLVRMRTWGVLALGAAGVVLLATSATHLLGHACPHHTHAWHHGVTLIAGARPLPIAVVGGLLVAIAAPFVRPMGRWIASR